MTPPWSSRSASPLSGQLILSALLGSATSIRPLREALGRSEDGGISVEDTEFSAEEYARYQADVAEESRPPFQAPDGLAAAVAAARAAGLLAPVACGDEPGRYSCTGGQPGPSPRSAPAPPGTPTSGQPRS